MQEDARKVGASEHHPVASSPAGHAYVGSSLEAAEEQKEEDSRMLGVRIFLRLNISQYIFIYIFILLRIAVRYTNKLIPTPIK